MSEMLAHLILAIAVLAAYVGLTIVGEDGNVLLGVLAGQAGAIGVERVSKRRDG